LKFNEARISEWNITKNSTCGIPILSTDADRSNNFDIYDYVGKLSEQHFSVWFFSNPGDTILFLLKFNEARISEWNICVRETPCSV
jgi:hypothetical protein